MHQFGRSEIAQSPPVNLGRRTAPVQVAVVTDDIHTSGLACRRRHAVCFLRKTISRSEN
jgi:hypothetical protein